VLNQAVRWGWASQNLASLSQRKTTKKPPRGVMSLDDVRAAIAAAGEFDPVAALALRLAAMTGAPVRSWSRCDGPTSTTTGCWGSTRRSR
jgi:hypothetical protein